MAVQFTENQPIRVSSEKFADQTCVNKDNSDYAVLMQPGDDLYFQASQTACGGDLACDAETLGTERIANGDFSGGGSWTLGTGWVIGGGQVTYTSVGTNSQLLQSGLTLIGGASYKITIDVVSNDTGLPLDVFFGGRRVAQIGANDTGTQTIYGECGTTDEFAIRPSNDYSLPAAGTVVVLDNISIKQDAICYTFGTSTTDYIINGGFDGSASGWILNSNWAYSTDDVTATGSSTNLEQIINNIPHRADIRFRGTISAHSAGTFSVVYGNTTMSSGLSATYDFNYSAYSIGKIAGNTYFAIDATGLTATFDDIKAEETRSGWVYDPDAGFCHSTGWANAFTAGATLTIGVYYKILVQVVCSAGELVIACGGVTLGTVTQSGQYVYYFTATSTTGESFTPSEDFDGCVLDTISIVPLKNDYQIRLIYADSGAGATDWHTSASSTNPLSYDDEYVTWYVASLASVLSGGSPIALPYSCYKLQFYDTCTDTVFESENSIAYDSSHSCTKLISAYCSGIALGFNFDNGNIFKLNQRLRVLYINPNYPADAEDYEFSNGNKRRIFAKSEKKYVVWLDYMGEYEHDCMRVQLLTDTMLIDAVQYIADGKDYEPEWQPNGKRNLAQSRFEAMKANASILFNRNV